MQYGLIGKTLKHSYSVEVHNKIAGYPYELLELAEQEIEDFFKNRTFKGINVTIPYKQTVIPYLDSISESAKKIGAVNTVVNKNGKLFGYNTDCFGMTALINHSKATLCGKKVLILGTGGTSKTAQYVAKSLNADKVYIVSRTARDGVITYADAKNLHSDAQIIINTTPLGMYPENMQSPINVSDFPKLECVFDAIYNPLSTKLLLDAKSQNISAFGGLYMLVAQAVMSYSLFFDRELDTKIIDKIYNSLKKEKQNIVLIGMPSSGKSTIGKILSKNLNMPFFDSDAEIFKKYNMQISDIFAKFGEADFRQKESDVIFELSKLGGIIIATGGGAILNPDNVTALRQNGILVFLNRSLDKLVATSDRPLSSNRDALKKLFNARYPIYKSVADITANSDLSPEEVANNIQGEIL